MTNLVLDDSTSGSPRGVIDDAGPNGVIVADWSAGTIQGRQRVQNEDAWAQFGPVFVVADGMGGLALGSEASGIATQTIVERWMSVDDHRGELPSPEEVVRLANDEVRRLAAQTSRRVGSTLSGLRVMQDRAVIVHAGDSRIYRIRNGHMELLTRDHNLRAELLSAGIVPRAGDSPGPLRSLTSFLGLANADLSVDVRSVALNPGDRLLLCTDGVYHRHSHAALSDLASRGSAELTAARLTTDPDRDDATAIVIDFASLHDRRNPR